MANSSKTDFVLPMIYGVVAHVILHYGVQAYTQLAATSANSGSPLWYTLSYPLAWAIAATAPGFLAGWFATNRGFLLGGAIGFVASMIEQPTIDMTWGSSPIGWNLALIFVAYALSPAVVSAVACAAGRSARPSRAEPETTASAPAKSTRR